MTDDMQREAFEQWSATTGEFCLDRWKKDTAKYAHYSTQYAWSGWQAPIRHMREQERPLLKFQPCGCVICTCEDEVQCQGCGAKMCGTFPHPEYVREQEDKE